MEESAPKFQEPTVPTPNIVVVTNISANTNEKVLREFFSFCGDIEELHLSQTGDTQKAIIKFTRESAARTALLLSNAYLGEKNIFVESYFENLPPYVNQDVFSDNEEKDQPVPTQIRQEDKPKLSIMVELLANGYVLNDRIIDGAKSFDEKHGITSTFKRYFTRSTEISKDLNEKYQLSMKAEVLAQTAKGVASDIDNTYHVTEKIHNVSEDVQKRAAEIDGKYHVTQTIGAATTSVVSLAESAMASETGQKIQGFLFDVWNKAKVINEEARKKAIEKEGKDPNIITTQDLNPNANIDQPTTSPQETTAQPVLQKEITTENKE